MSSTHAFVISLSFLLPSFALQMGKHVRGIPYGKDWWCKWLSLGAFCVQNSLTPIAFRYAMTETSANERASTSMILLYTETLKFVMSSILFLAEEGFDVIRGWRIIKEEIVHKPYASFPLGVPAVVYAMQNVLLQWSSGNLSAALWQVTYQGKILVTAMFSVVILRKQIKRVQWLAIAAMGWGIAMVQLSDAKESKQADMANSLEQSIPKGLIMLLLACCCSGFASVYTEKILKQVGNTDGQKKLSVWVQNMLLAFFTILIMGFSFGIETMHTATGHAVPNQDSRGIFHGFTLKICLLGINNAIGGLLVALVIKYSDNILRGFASAIATMNCAMISVFTFGFILRPSFAIGAALVVGSTLLYGNVLSLPGEWWNSEPTMLTAAFVRDTISQEKQANQGAAQKSNACESSEPSVGNTA